jgi:D-amino peptidase
MRIAVAVDMEGITGICCREQTLPGESLYAEGCDLMAGDINAVVEGLVDAGVDDIVVWDCHSRSFNARLPGLHPAARYLRGSAANGLRLPIVDAATDGVILLGYHAMAGTLHAVLEHTMSSESWFRLRVNGRAIGEIAYDAALAGAVGVPVLMVSGDDKACAEARDFLAPGVTTVCVKQGLARQAAVLVPPARTRALLRKGAHRAATRPGRAQPFRFRAPATVELTFKHTGQADTADLRPFRGRRLDGYTVQWTAPSFADWHGFTTKNPPAGPKRPPSLR